MFVAPRRQTRTVLAVFAAVLAYGSATSCTEPVVATVVQSVQFETQSDSVLLGKTYQTRVKVLDQQGAEIQGKRVTYASQQPNVVTIDGNGVATAVAGGGTATITATVEKRTGQMLLKVLTPVQTITIAPASSEIIVGQQRTLAATATDRNGLSIAGRNLTWSSSAPNVAIVQPGGLVTAVSPGTARIQVESALDAVKGEAVVNVIVEPVASIRIEPIGAQQTMRLGTTMTFVARPLGVAGNVLTNPPRSVAWVSSNTSVATINQSGLVTAIGLGQTTITAESETKREQVLITVTEVPARSVRLSPDTLKIATGLSGQITATVIDSLNRLVPNLTTRNPLWVSNNPAVATVSGAGVVSGITRGSARISLTVDNVRSNDVVVVVDDQVAEIRLEPFLPQLMRPGGRLQVVATPYNNQGQPIAGRAVTWASQHPTVATVSPTGLITAVGLGNATLTAVLETKTASITVSVQPIPIASITFEPSVDTVVVGDQKQYNPTVIDSAGNLVTNFIGRSVIFNSNNYPVATPNNQGVVLAALQGQAIISAIIDNVQSNNLLLRVVQVSEVSVTPLTIFTSVGNSVQLNVVIKDSNGNILKSNRSPLFTSNNNGIANISATGLVTGVGVGQTVVNAQFNNIVRSVTVNVNP